jgi:hypothetical protein
VPVDLEKIQTSITKTGFQLEYSIGNLLRKSGWTLISNRCYIDDLEGTVREMDLLAYKVSHIKDFSLYTAVIISCKKNESNAWALLSRPVEPQDPNYNWRPFKGWSNHAALKYYINGKNWAHAYHEKLLKECPALFQPPPVDVFAFQEINKNSGNIQNDKAIFSSITSLMKAQSYEMSILESRQKNKKRIYQFNLVSLIDSEMVRVFFDDDKITASSVESEDYLCRYILNKEEAIARIKFVTAEAFPEVIKDYSKLHAQNKEIFSEYYEKFYSDAYKVSEKSELLIGEFNNKVKRRISNARYHFTKTFEMSDVSIDYNSHTEELTVDLDYDDVSNEMMESFNKDANLKAFVAEALKEVYHYEGKFSFEIAIPF